VTSSSTPDTTRPPQRRYAADLWLLVGSGLEGRWVTGELVDALTRAFGQRCAVVRTSDLLLGVRDGRLTLRDLDGRPVATPRVVYARLASTSLSTDREITLLRQLAAMGTVLVNPIDGVLGCANKFWQLQQLVAAGLPVPDTHTYVDAPLSEVLRAGVPEPCVVKSVRGSHGDQVFLAPSGALLGEIHGSLRTEAPYLFQRYVATSHGRDLRVVVVDGRAVAAEVRCAVDGGVKANLALGGSATLCLGLHPAGEALAVRAAAAMGLAVAGVDLLFEADGGFTVCEVNANVAWREHMSKQVTPAVVAACAMRLSAAA
jgi:RimK family alpha-L-glutamate ligase